MDNINTENSELAKQYQDILDRYSKELSLPSTKPTVESVSKVEVTPPTPVIVPPVSIIPPTPIFETIPPVEPVKNNPFKYLFYFSLIIFLGVASGIVYTLFFSKPTKKPMVVDDTPITVSPSPSESTKYCEVNDKQIKMGESIPATDGCNTCTCGPDLTISCTVAACVASPSITATPTKAKLLPKAQKLPADLTKFVKFQVIKQSTVPITESQIVIGESLLSGDFAQVAASGTILWAVKKESVWTLVTSGQEPPKCSVLTPYNFPTDFDCQN